MLSSDDSLHVHDSGRIIHSDDSNGKNRRRHRSKTFTRTRRKNALREHPFLPKEITDKIISFANSFGFRIILAAKVGKLIHSSKPTKNMSAYCCVFYVDNEGLKEGLVSYRFGKISFLSNMCGSYQHWLKSFSITYKHVAEQIQYSVLVGAVEPAIVPGLFLKSNNVARC